MKRQAAVYGVGVGINGQEAAMRATQRALDQLGTARPALALVFAAQEFQMSEVLAGLTALLGETPLWGFGTTLPLTGEGEQPRAVVVALLTGADLKADVRWFPNFTQDSPEPGAVTARQLVQQINQEVFLPQELLIAADGINGRLAPLCAELASVPVRVSGCTAAGDPALGRTYCFGKNQAGAGALAAAALGGSFRLGVGLAHGWRDLGVHFRVAQARDLWVSALEDSASAQQMTPAEAYARWFGYPARAWAYPPLSSMARLYPLGLEDAESAAGSAQPLLLRSALRVEVDGSLRMSAPVPQGALAHLMSADLEACLEAARAAAQQALADLGSARPLLAVALVDAAWQVLFEPAPERLPAALKSALGDIPVAGAYTFGQLARPALDAPPVLHNQNIEILVFGEEE